MPIYLREDIDKFDKCVNKEEERDFYIHWMDLSSSINIAQHNGDISFSLADEIREEWL